MLSPTALNEEFRRALEAAGRALFIPSWPEIPLLWNRRLRRAGRATIDNAGTRFKSALIELSPPYFEVYPEDLPGILIHEAIHVGLALQGRPSGHGTEFQRACTAAGGLQYSRWLPGRIYRYRCPVCGSILERRRRAADSRWCADCAAEAEHSGLEVFSATRALVLVETAFLGPEPAHQAAQPVCEPHGKTQTTGEGRVEWTESGTPLRYPVRSSNGRPLPPDDP